MPIGSPQWMYNAVTLEGDRDDNYYSYEIDYSLRLDRTKDTYLSRSWTDTNTTATHSVWIKKIGQGYNGQQIITNSAGFYDTFKGEDDIMGYGATGGDEFRTQPEFRDPAAWFHYVKIIDSSEGSAANRTKVYINGVQQTLNFSGTGGAGNVEGWTAHNGQMIGHDCECYIAEYHYIAGQVKAATDFGEAGDYGDWKPKAYTGSYTGNSFYLDFADSGDLGDDESGLGNDWTENNITADDQMVDTPTNNFCVINPLQQDIENYGTTNETITEGGLKISTATTFGTSSDFYGTMGVTSGKWYFEAMRTGGNVDGAIGWGCGEGNARQAYYTSNGNRYYAGGSTSYGASVGTSDIIGVAFDADEQTLEFYKNNASQGEITSAVPAIGGDIDTYRPFGWDGSGSLYSIWRLNFGADSSFSGEKTAQGNSDANNKGDFYYTPPDGYLGLCTNNLLKPIKPSDYFETSLYTGNQSSNVSVTDVGFQPDLVWGKNRSGDSNWWAFDGVRGTTKMVSLDQGDGASAAEETQSGITAFNSNGFTLGSWIGSSKTGDSYVAYSWKGANSSGSSNEEGSINTTKTAANTDAGFSIMTYTGTGANATIGHGLDKAPEFVIVHMLDASRHRWVYHKGAASDAETDYSYLTNTSIFVDQSVGWNDTAPTDSVVSIGSEYDVNGNTKLHLAWCWHSVEGFSKFGHYFGTGSASAPGHGAFITCGFTPSMVLVKRVTVAHDWVVVDTARSPINGENYKLVNVNTSSAEDTDPCIEIVSNGFKINDTALRYNSNGERYIYMAWAQTPFKYANAR